MYQPWPLSSQSSPSSQGGSFIHGMDITMILYIQTTLLLKDPLTFLILFFPQNKFDNYLLIRILLLDPLNKKEPNVLRSQLRIIRWECKKFYSTHVTDLHCINSGRAVWTELESWVNIGRYHAFEKDERPKWPLQKAGIQPKKKPHTAKSHVHQLHKSQEP